MIVQTRGSSITKARDALRSAAKRERAFTSIWDRWQNDETNKKSQLAHKWSDAWIEYLDHIVHSNIYHNATQPQRERYANLHHLRSVDENQQAPPPWQRPGVPGSEKGIVKSSRKEKNKFLISQQVTRSVYRTELTLHYKSTWNG